MKIAIIMCHFGDKIYLTKECIQTLFKYEKLFSEIVISNNNTKDLDLSLLTNQPNVKVVNNGKNLGYAAGINRAVQKAKEDRMDYVFIINNDCSIDKPFLGELLKAVKESDASIAYAPLKYKKNDGWIFDIGGFINFYGFPFHIEKEKLGNKLIPIDFAGCFLISVKDFLGVGGFDEHFFLYYEDIDLSLRLKRKDKKIISVPNAYIYHGISKTVGFESPLAVYHQTRSALVYFKRFIWNKWYSPIFLLKFISVLTKRILNNPRNFKYGVVGFMDGFTGRIRVI